MVTEVPNEKVAAFSHPESWCTRSQDRRPHLHNRFPWAAMWMICCNAVQWNDERDQVIQSHSLRSHALTAPNSLEARCFLILIIFAKYHLFFRLAFYKPFCFCKGFDVAYQRHGSFRCNPLSWALCSRHKSDASSLPNVRSSHQGADTLWTLNLQLWGHPFFTCTSQHNVHERK